MAFCLQAMVSQRTVPLCVNKSEFVMAYHCKRIIKLYLQHCRHVVYSSGSVTLEHVNAEATTSNSSFIGRLVVSFL